MSETNTQQTNLNAPSTTDKAPPAPKYPLLYATELNVGRHDVSLAFPWTAWERGPRYEAGEMFPGPLIAAENLQDAIAWLTPEDTAEALAEIVTRVSRKIADGVRDEVVASGVELNSTAGSEKFKTLFEKYMQELTVARETIATLNKNNQSLAAEMAETIMKYSELTANGDIAGALPLMQRLATLGATIKRNNASIQSKRRQKDDENSSEQPAN